MPFRFEGVEFGVESRTVAVGGQMVTIQGIAGRYEDLLVPLHGAHQAENAAVAIAALEAFFGGEKAIDAELLQEAFASVTSPGRLEVVRTSPTIIVDAAHNPEGIRVSAEAIHEAFNLTKLVVVVGVLREKDAEEILRQLKESLGGLAAEYCFTESNSPRAVPAADLAEIAADLGFGEDNIHVAEKLDDALEWAVERAEANDELAGGVACDRLHHAGRRRPHPARKGGRVSDGQSSPRPSANGARACPKNGVPPKSCSPRTVLLLEAFVVLFGMLAVFGLHRNEFPPAVVFSVGIGLCLVFVLTCAVLSKPWGVALGWILQLLLILSGIVEPAMYLVGALFAVAWWYGIRTGIRIDREAAQREREQADWEAAHPRARRPGISAWNRHAEPRSPNPVDLTRTPPQTHWSSCEH